MKYKTHKKFLSVDLFEKVKNLIMNQDFPWRKRDPHNNIMYFTYSFYNTMNSSSEFYEPHIIPILKKLQAEAPIQVRAHMIVSKLFKESNWHCDYPFNCTTAILYLNDCDGGTELKIDNKITFIKADPNKMLIFDTNILHRSITSKKEPIRYIINFNYFTSETLSSQEGRLG
jgi:hypothetical protein